MNSHNKSSIVILAVVIIVIAGVIGVGLYQNSDKSRNSTPDEISTTQIATTEEPTTEEVTTVAPTTEEPTTEKPTEKPTEPPTTKAPETEPQTQTNKLLDMYNSYLDTIHNYNTVYYYIFDINNDGNKELILEIGEFTYNRHPSL